MIFEKIIKKRINYASFIPNYTYTYKKLQEIHFQRGTGVPRFTHNKGYEDK